MRTCERLSAQLATFFCASCHSLQAHRHTKSRCPVKAFIIRKNFCQTPIFKKTSAMPIYRHCGYEISLFYFFTDSKNIKLSLISSHELYSVRFARDSGVVWLFSFALCSLPSFSLLPARAFPIRQRLGIHPSAGHKAVVAVSRA